MIFEIGKAYEHTTGTQLYICGKIDTFGFGETLIAEGKYGFKPVGIGEGYTVNYFEIPVEKYKLDNFDLGEKEKKHCLRKLKLNNILREEQSTIIKKN